MQRVRIGLTGLACVFLLVVLAASMFGLVGDRDVERAAPDNAATAAAPREPLAELGVAPGNAPEQGTTNAVQPLPATGGPGQPGQSAGR